MKPQNIYHPGKEKLKAALLKVALKETAEDQQEDIELEFSVKYKRGINRIYREIIGLNEIPHPEADTLFERIRSAVIVKFRKLRRK